MSINKSNYAVADCLRASLRMIRCAAAVLLLASIQCDAGAQQADAPYASQGSGRIEFGSTPIRIWHSTRGYGQGDGATALGGRFARPTEYGIYFIDGQIRESNSGDFGMNAGLGVRWRYESLLSSATRIFGVSGWYDGHETNLNNYFNQGGISVESLGEMFDLRFNANLPGESVQIADNGTLGDFFYTGNNVRQLERSEGDVSLSNVNAEIALRVPDMNLWCYGGVYQLDGDGVSATGYKLGARGYAYDDLALDLGVSDDNEFGTLATFQVIWTPGRVSPGITQSVHNIHDRMREPVYRPMYVATQRRTFVTNISDLTDENGDIQSIVHVDSNATAPGDGTFENPLTSLDDIFANSGDDDIVLVHSGSNHSGESATLRTGQRFLGEGNDVIHQVNSQDFLLVDLPETSAGARAGAVPVIDGAPIAAVQVGATALADTTSIEVNNLQIINGDVGIRSEATGTGTLNVANVEITDTASHGIEIVGSEATHNFIRVTVTDAGDAAGEAGLRISGGAANVNMSGQIVQGAAATGAAAVSVAGGHTGTVNMALPSGSATGSQVVSAENGTGLQFDDADGTYTINGPVELNGGDAGIDLLNDTDGTINLTNTTITNPTGTAINVEDGDGSMSFTGLVTQTNNATALAVSAGHNGTLDFNESTAAAGVFDVTNGDGLQFNNADGAYRFNDSVSLNGGDAGIDILAGSEGTMVFSNATIENPTGDALVVNGSSAIVTYSGAITNNAGRAVVVESNTDADVIVNGTITDTANGVLVQNNTGTSARLAGVLDLTTGANTAVTVLNNTTGGASFGTLNLNTTSGTALLVNNSENIEVTGGTSTITTTTGTAVSITDSIVGANDVALQSVSTDGAAQPIVLTNITGGTITVGQGGTAAGDGGTIQNSTGTAIAITDVENVTINAVRIDGAAGDGVSIAQTNGISPEEMTVAVTNARITLATGSGINLNSAGTDDISLTLDGNNIDDTTQAAIALDFNGDNNTSSVTITNNIASNATGEEALLLTTTGANTNTVNLLVESNTFNNNDPTSFAADIRVEAPTGFNATILTNNFANTDAVTGVPVRVQSNNAGANLRLNLDGNTATPGLAANDGYQLDEVSGSFTVENLADVDTRNNGTVNVGAGIVNDAGSIPQP